MSREYYYYYGSNDIIKLLMCKHPTQNVLPIAIVLQLLKNYYNFRV